MLNCFHFYLRWYITSPEARWAPTFSWRPFRPAWLRVLSPWNPCNDTRRKFIKKIRAEIPLNHKDIQKITREPKSSPRSSKTFNEKSSRLQQILSKCNNTRETLEFLKKKICLKRTHLSVLHWDHVIVKKTWTIIIIVIIIRAEIPLTIATDHHHRHHHECGDRK